ncbi:MAG: 3-beta hydroxysteroid dehydrogenase, partial [Microbacteriaceae bacterium]
SGRLLANACEADVPAEFWRQVYNIGGGETCRINYVDYLDRVFKVLGLGSVSKLTERNWFALKNFHCQWFLDSDVLEEYLHFRQDGIDEYIAHMAASAPWYLRIGLAKLVPPALIRALVMKVIARRPEGPLHWIETEDIAKIQAFFGSRAEWESIPDWEELIPETETETEPEPESFGPLVHGFDDQLPDSKLGLVEAQSAAAFRGGSCHTLTLDQGELYTPVEWSCAFGHHFQASLYLVLRAGHWCSECEAPPWRYEQIAAVNPFIAQLGLN